MDASEVESGGGDSPGAVLRRMEHSIHGLGLRPHQPDFVGPPDGVRTLSEEEKEKNVVTSLQVGVWKNC